MRILIKKGVGRAGVLLAGLAVAAGTALFFATQTQAKPVASTDPGARLQCAGENYATTQVHHDDWTVETATPEEQADRWASAMELERPDTPIGATRTVTYVTASLADVAFSDGGSTLAVLTYEHRDGLGWWLDSIVECA